MLLRAVLAIVALCAAAIVLKDARHWRTGDPRHASFRTVVISVLILLGLSWPVLARPSPYPPVTQFSGDRYSAQAQMGADVAKAVKVQRARKAARSHRWRRVPMPRARPGIRQVPIWAPLAEPGAVEPLSAVVGAVRETIRAVGRPRAWCGWWLGRHLGMTTRHLWKASNWASVGSNAGGPRVGAIVVWRHHVGIITGHNAMGWVVKSGNDGHRVRERVRSLAGAIAFRSSS